MDSEAIDEAEPAPEPEFTAVESEFTWLAVVLRLLDNDVTEVWIALDSDVS